MSFVKSSLTLWDGLSHCFHISSLKSTPEIQGDEHCWELSLDYSGGDIILLVEGCFLNWLGVGELTCFHCGAISLYFDLVIS
jgi:hypothetical protein